MVLKIVEKRRKRVALDDLLTPEEFAKKIKVKRDRVYKWIQRGHLTVHQFGPDSHPTYLIRSQEADTEEVKQLIRKGIL